MCFVPMNGTRSNVPGLVNGQMTINNNNNKKMIKNPIVSLIARVNTSLFA